MKEKTEVWREHPDIPGIEVSTLGRVRTFDKVVSIKKTTQFIKENILKQMVSSEKRTQFVKGHVLKQYSVAGGYLQVSIPIEWERTNKYVHRLVAETFIPNPDNLPEVNHLDCDRKNNNVENLEFCTRQENMQYREEFGKALGQPVLAINLATLEAYRFESQNEASRALGIQQPNISNAIKGKYKQAGGYRFENAK